MSLIRLQFALLWAARGTWAVIAFTLLLVITAMGFGGWVQNPSHILFTGWIALLLHAVAMFVLMVSQNEAKYEYFVGLNQARAFQKAQTAVFICSQIPIILIWGLVFGIMTDTWLNMGYICIVMILFCTICAEAVFGNLQTHLQTVPKCRRLALLLVVAGPWVLTAWILGWIAAEFICIPQQSFCTSCLPVLGLGGLGFFQWWIGRQT